MESEEQKAAIGTVELCGQVLYLRWRTGAAVGESDAKAMMNHVTELCSGRALPMLVQLASMEWIDRRAQEVFAAQWPLLRTAIVGTSPVDEVIAGFYTARHNPACPTRFFTSTDEAMTWLTEE